MADVPEPLELRLVALADEVAWPDSSTDLPRRISDRIAAAPEGWRIRWWPARPPLRRSLLVAVALLLVLAAVAAAVGLGLPGLRITFGPPSSPSEGPGVTSSGLPAGLGTRSDLTAVPDLVGFDPLLPPSLGRPAAAFVAGRRLTLVWPADDSHPPVAGASVGILATEFRGLVEPGWYEKVVDSRAATVEPVDVAGNRGFWISGHPHELVYRDPRGAFIQESRRIVGDVLVWRAGDLTLRLETALDRAATIALAESFVAAD